MEYMSQSQDVLLGELVDSVSGERQAKGSPDWDMPGPPECRVARVIIRLIANDSSATLTNI